MIFLSHPGWRFGNSEKALAAILLISLLGFGILVGLVHRGFEGLSTARAYVAGEAHWSKAQKDAVYHLVRYTLHGGDEQYQRFLSELDVIHGNRQARLELEADEPDMQRVRHGFLRGRNHPEDVDRLAAALSRYRDLPYAERALTAWEEGDAAVDELVRVGQRIRLAREAGAGPGELEPLLAEVDELNRELTDLEARFSAELGEGARWAQGFLFRVVLGTAGGLALLTGGLGWTLTRRLRRAEASLRASEARYRGLYENSPFGIYRADANHRIVEANPTLLQLLDRKADDVLGTDARGWFPASADDGALEGDGGDPTTQGTAWLPPRELHLEGRHGSMTVRLTGRGLLTATGLPDGYEMYVEDITRSRLLVKRLSDSQKMEAVGHLGAGVAQDFNNLLTVVISSASRVRRDVKANETDKALRNLDLLDRSSGQATEIVEKLLAFSRLTPLQPRPLDLPRLVEESRGLLESITPPEVELRLAFGDCPPVHADPRAVGRILENLVRNAGEAMPDGGVLDISTEAPSPDEAHEESKVVLRVRDTGAGMPSEVLEHALEPFFTTKGSHAGTGLGLAMVHGLVRQHGGGVTVRSEEGSGTEVEVSLIAQPSGPRPEGDETGSPAPTAGDAQPGPSPRFHRRGPQ